MTIPTIRTKSSTTTTAPTFAAFIFSAASPIESDGSTVRTSLTITSATVAMRRRIRAQRSSRESRRSLRTRPPVWQLRAVVDRVLLEVDLRERRAADVARLAEPAVDAVGRRRRRRPPRAARGRARARRSSPPRAARPPRRRGRSRARTARASPRGGSRSPRRGRCRRSRAGRGAAGAAGATRARRISPSALGVEPERLGPEVRELGLGRLGREQPDAGALLPRVLGEDELRAAGELERERGRLRALPRRPAANFSRPAVIRWTSSTSSPSSVGKRSRLPRRSAPRKLPALERGERRVERLQRGDVRRPGLRDRERRHGVVQLAPPRLHLRKLGHRLDGSAARRPRRRDGRSAPRSRPRRSGGHRPRRLGEVPQRRGSARRRSASRTASVKLRRSPRRRARPKPDGRGERAADERRRAGSCPQTRKRIDGVHPALHPLGRDRLAQATPAGCCRRRPRSRR